MASLEVARMIILESVPVAPRPRHPGRGAVVGGMLGEGRVYVLPRWWLATFPGLAIFVTTLGINLLDPHRRAAGASPAEGRERLTWGPAGPPGPFRLD